VSASRSESRLRSPHGVEGAQLRSRTWNGVTVHALDIAMSPGRGWSDLSSDKPSLSIVLEEVGGRVEPRLKLDQSLVKDDHAPGLMSLVPAGMTLWGYTEGIRRVRESRLDFDFSALSQKLGEDLDRLKTQTPLLLFRDERIRRLGALLGAEAEREAPDDLSDLYGDSLIVALAIDLLRLGKRPPPEQKRGGLARWQLRRVTEYMREHHASTIKLADLAEMAGLSQSQLGRAFKASTGVTPHRFLLNQRIARAQELLLAGSMSLAEIALATGFAEQSHFTRVFRREIGASPGAFRRDRRG
jgi:AraC family transcriptional regulator